MTTGYRYDLNIAQGIDFALNCIVKDCDGNVRNLSGYSGEALIMQRYGDSGALGAFAVTVTSPVSGKVSMSLAGTGSAALPVTQAAYQLVLDNSGSKLKYLFGYVSFYPTLA